MYSIHVRTLLIIKLSHRERHFLTSPFSVSSQLFPLCPLITVIILLLSQHQSQVILFDPVWPFCNACHWPYSYVYIMSLENHEYLCCPCNWMLSMKWNTTLLEGCLPWDTNLNLHIAHCIQITLQPNQQHAFGCKLQMCFIFKIQSDLVSLPNKLQKWFPSMFCQVTVIGEWQMCGRNEKKPFLFSNSSISWLFTETCLLPSSAPNAKMDTMYTASFSSNTEKITIFSSMVQ